MIRGLWYSVPILAILGCHELGHYYACRYYGVAASRPYFLPMPLVLTGTLGAFIRIRQPIPSKRQLFDIGIAGPIAGFVIAVPVLFIGMYLSKVERDPPRLSGRVVLARGAAALQAGGVADVRARRGRLHRHRCIRWRLPDGSDMLATALNLFPIGQLDGGHISYAVLGRKSSFVTLVMVACLIGLAFWSHSWFVWAGLTVLMLLVFGPHHPRTPDEDVPLDPTRKALAVFAVIMFILCFTPAPIELMDIVTASATQQTFPGTFRPPPRNALDDVDDAGLIALARRGDAVAFSRLFAGFERPIFRYAAHMCGRDAADDIVQDTFLAVLQRVGRVRPGKGTVGNYLFGIARHFVLKRLSSREIATFELDEHDERTAWADDRQPTVLDIHVTCGNRPGRARSDRVSARTLSRGDRAVRAAGDELRRRGIGRAMPGRHRALAAASRKGAAHDEALGRAKWTRTL